ncbi:unnamed protein product, partial [Tilletia controversa]
MAANESLPHTEVLSRIFSKLKSEQPSIRRSASLELRKYVKQVPAEFRLDPLSAFNNDLTMRTVGMSHAAGVTEKLGGIAAIEQLVHVDMGSGDESKRYLYRLYQLLRHNLPSNSAEVMTQASKALGMIVQIAGPTFTDQFMEMETHRALDLLSARDEFGRYAAVCIIRELASSVPNLLYPFVPRILDHRIWSALRDTKLQIREAAARALGACLKILSGRSKTLDSYVPGSVWKEAYEGLIVQKTAFLPAPEAIHGNLLAVQQLCFHSRAFMEDHLDEACDAIIPLHRSRDLQIRRTVVSDLIPGLARCDPTLFKERLHGVITALIDQMRKDKGDRETWEQSFKAIGLLASIMRGGIEPYARIIVSSLKEGFLMRGKKIAPFEAYMFGCISNLAIALGERLIYSAELLRLMLTCPISAELVDALEKMVDSDGSLKPRVQDRLLDHIALVLIKKPEGSAVSPPRSRRGSRDSASPEIVEDTGAIVIALNTLGSFDFNGHMLSNFVRSCTLPHLKHENVEVRKAAAVSCAKWFSQDPISCSDSIHAIEVVNDVLDQLVAVAIADPDPILRCTVLQHLTGFDHHLAQDEHVRSIFIALNDEVFDVRRVAASMIGRLAQEMPSVVMPQLRKALIRLLTELDYAVLNRRKREATKLLTELLRSSQHLLKWYVLPILHVLLPKARDEDARVAARAIECLGELAKIGGDDLSKSVKDIIALVVDELNANTTAGSTSKRDAALRTLGLVVSNCGYEENPYLQHRALLGNLIKILRTEQAPEIRRESIRVMGVLGALDPFRYKLLDRSSDDSTREGAKDGSVDLFELAMMAGPTSDEYCQNVAVEELLKVLRDSALTAHHYLAIEGLTYMFQTQGLKCANFLPQVIPAFLHVIQTCPAAHAESYYPKLAQLVGFIKQHIRNYLPQVFALIKDKWTATPNAQGPIVDLIQALAKSLQGEFKAYLPQVLPDMIQTLEADVASRREAAMRKILDTFAVLGANLEDYLQLVLPAIAQVLEHPDAAIKLRIAAAQTLGTLARRLNICDHASQVIQPLLRSLGSGPPELQSSILDTLTVIGAQLGDTFKIFVPIINKVIAHQDVRHERYERLSTRALQGIRITPDLAGPDPAIAAKVSEAPVADLPQLQVNERVLKQAWDTSNVSTAEDWREWLRRIAVEFLRESPSHGLRACRTLAENHQPVALALFNAAFTSCFKLLEDSCQANVLKAIETALHAPDTPDQVVATLLNLAEHAEHDSKGMAIDAKVLGDCALKYGLYAKAIHYKETEYFQQPSSKILESLIDINTKLQNIDAAQGALQLAEDDYQVKDHQEWFEKLHRWEDALHAYDEKLRIKPDSWTSNFGRMRCLHALGEWEQLSNLVHDRWTNPGVREDQLNKMAPLAAAAAWSLGHWDRMDDYIGAMRS